MNKKSGFLVLYLFLISSIGFPQDYKGIWQGYISGIGGPYKNTNYTLNIKTQQGNVVIGRAYIFSDYYRIHESTLDFIGDINKNTLKITELSIIRSITTLPRQVVCIKFADLKLSSKNNINYLTGYWNGSTEEGIHCIPGEVYLKKISPGQSDDINSIPEVVMQEITQDQSRTITFRETELTKPVVINVNSRQITLEINDYMREDNDTVSVYYNRKLIIDKLRIKKQPYQYSLRLERQAGLNEIILYANNLGAIPRNTSQLIIRDGISIQKVLIESTKQISAVIYLRYTPNKSL